MAQETKNKMIYEHKLNCYTHLCNTKVSKRFTFQLVQNCFHVLLLIIVLMAEYGVEMDMVTCDLFYLCLFCPFCPSYPSYPSSS